MSNTTPVKAESEAGAVTQATLSDDARAYAIEALSPNTRRAYATQWKRWLAHAYEANLTPLPADPVAVANWLAGRAKCGAASGKRAAKAARNGGQAVGQSPSTVRVAVAAIKAVHEAAHIPFDSEHHELRRVLRGITKTKSAATEQAAPLTADELMQVISRMGNNPLEIRDAALLALGYAFARRRSELAGLNLETADETDMDCSGVLRVTARALEIELHRHKTRGNKTLKAIVPREGSELAMQAIERWLELANAQPGQPVLRAIDRHGKISSDRMHPQSISGAIQRRLKAHYIGLGNSAAAAEREAARFSGHSLRRGFCTTAARAGASLQAIMGVTGHRSVPIVLDYIDDAQKEVNSPHRIACVGLGRHPAKA